MKTLLIKCLKCGYIGKPKKNLSDFGFLHILIWPFLVAYIINWIIYRIKDYPAKYSCPKCKKSRANFQNLEIIKNNNSVKTKSMPFYKKIIYLFVGIILASVITGIFIGIFSK